MKNPLQVLIINGPNLNLLGKRETGIYGTQSFEDYFLELKKEFNDFNLEYYQSNVEGELINKLHETGFSYDGIIINAGGYTHTSVAIGDAVAGIKTTCIEVHISNIFSREEFRHHSYLSAHCKGVICGLGLSVYKLELISFRNSLHG